MRAGDMYLDSFKIVQVYGIWLSRYFRNKKMNICSCSIHVPRREHKFGVRGMLENYQDGELGVYSACISGTWVLRKTPTNIRDAVARLMTLIEALCHMLPPSSLQ